LLFAACTPPAAMGERDMQQAVSARTPAHLWIVGALSLLWSCFGALDYLMSRMHNEAFFKAMMPNMDPAVAYSYMDSMPLYASLGWGLGVWGGLLGSVLLLARSRYAVHAFAASILGMVLSFGYQLFVAKNVPAEMQSPVMPAVVAVIGIALLLYSRAMSARGLLR
jgi:hypothetical protein